MVESEKHLDTMPVGLEISCKTRLFHIFSGDVFSDGHYRTFLNLPIYRPDSWRSRLRCHIQNQKDLGSNSTTCLAGSWDPTLMQGTQWPWGWVSINTVTDSKTCSKTLCRDFNLAIEGALGWQGNMAVVLFFSRFYISCSYSCTISFLVKILLVKLKNLYIQYAWISIIKNEIVTKKDDGICQNFLLSLFHLSSKFVM